MPVQTSPSWNPANPYNTCEFYSFATPSLCTPDLQL